MEFSLELLFFSLPCFGWKKLLLTGIPLSGIILSETNSKPSIKYCSSLCSKLFWEFLRIWPPQNDFCLPSNSSKIGVDYDRKYRPQCQSRTVVEWSRAPALPPCEVGGAVDRFPPPPQYFLLFVSISQHIVAYGPPGPHRGGWSTDPKFFYGVLGIPVDIMIPNQVSSLTSSLIFWAKFERLFFLP